MTLSDLWREIDRIVTPTKYEGVFSNQLNRLLKLIASAISGVSIDTAGKTGLISGATVWTGSGLDFSERWTYEFDSRKIIQETATLLTCEAADSTYDRIDVIYVDSTGVGGILKGIASADPQEPTLDPVTQIKTTIVYIAANATTPSNITNEVVYDENAEWVTSSIPATNVTVNFDDTSNPAHGTKNIKIRNTAGGNISGTVLNFSAAGSFNSFGGNLIFSILLSTVINSNSEITLHLYNGGSGVGRPVHIRGGLYGFNHLLTSLQTLIIPVSDFGADVTLIDRLIVSILNRWPDGTILYLDNIYIQKGTSVQPLPYTLPIATADSLGGIRVGENLTIDPLTGILSAQAGSSGGIHLLNTDLIYTGDGKVTLDGSLFTPALTLAPREITVWKDNVKVETGEISFEENGIYFDPTIEISTDLTGATVAVITSLAGGGGTGVSDVTVDEFEIHNLLL